MITDKTVFSKANESYSERRMKNKNSFPVGVLLMFKGTIGLGFLVSQFFIGKAGILLGPLTAAFIIAFLAYCMILMTNIANKIEEDKKTTMDTMDQVVREVLGPKFQCITKLLNCVYNGIAINIALANLARFFAGRMEFIPVEAGVSQLAFFKLAFIFVMVSIVVIIIEPEKLKYTAMISTSILLTGVTLMWSLNLLKVTENKEPVNYHFVEFAGLATLVSTMMYSVESIGIVFTVRSTLKQPKKMNSILMVTFILIALIYVLNGLSFVSVG